MVAFTCILWMVKHTFVVLEQRYDLQTVFFFFLVKHIGFEVSDLEKSQRALNTSHNIHKELQT